jgi:hypothetical protein
MKRRQKSTDGPRWHPYWFLAVGAIFLLLALAEFCFYIAPPPPRDWLKIRYIRTYDGSGIGSEFAISICAGILLVAFSIYGLRRRKK